MSIDGEIPTVYFLIMAIGLTCLTYFVFKRNGKKLETYFLTILTFLFYLAYLSMLFFGPR